MPLIVVMITPPCLFRRFRLLRCFSAGFLLIFDYAAAILRRFYLPPLLSFLLAAFDGFVFRHYFATPRPLRH